jgi:biotin carboxyl carrier protein
MEAYMEARHLTQTFIDDFLGYFIDPKNRYLSSLMVQSGLPGGMMGSLMADLKGVHQGINYSLKEHGKEPLTEDQLLVQLFDEVAYVWPKLGYPPLVTPFSQYVKNVALLNIVQMAKGDERYSMMDDNTWSMILGKAGTLPGPLASEIIELAKSKNFEFYTGNPQDLYPDILDKYRKEMAENGWETGENDEELFEFAMHEKEYRDYKSGLAKKRFEDEIEKAKAKTSTKTTIAVNEKQTINRNSYNKNEVEHPIAMIAYLLHSLNSNPVTGQGSATDVWKTIGYWRTTKKVILTWEGKIHPVSLSKTFKGEYKFEIDGIETVASIIQVDKSEVDFKIGNESFFATITAAEKDLAKVTINKKDFLMIRNDLLDTKMATSGEDEALSASENKIISPLPGRVFKINVKEGDVINKGDIVAVIDAMKMENNIVAKREGKVKKVLVNVNDMIESASALIEIE